MERLFEGVQDKVRMRCPAGPPTDDPPGVCVDDEGDIDEAGPGRDIGKIREPQTVWSGSVELSVHVIQRTERRLVADRCPQRFAPDRPPKAHIPSGDSPLWPPARPNISHIHPSQTPWRRRSDPNGISKTRSRQSEDNSRSPWLEPCRAARVAKPSQLDHLCDHPTEDRRDTVELELCGKVGDGVNQAAGLISATDSIPSLNFIPLTTFGNWF